MNINFLDKIKTLFVLVYCAIIIVCLGSLIIGLVSGNINTDYLK
jgi:hypothetical protein